MLSGNIMKLESNQIKMLAHHNMNRKHWIRVRVAALETLTALSVSPLLPEEGGGDQYRRGVGRQRRGQRTEGDTPRREERGARCAAKVPGVIDVMTVYPSCCVATA